MANTNIWIEEKETNRWVAEVEVGGLAARRATVTAQTLSDLLVAVELKHAEILPPPVARPAAEIAADQAAVKKTMAEIEEEEARAVREAEQVADEAGIVRQDAQARAQQESDRLAVEVEGIKARERAEHREVPRTPAPAPLNSSEAKVDDARQLGASPLPPAPGVDRVGGMRQREIDAPPSQPTTDMRPTAAEAVQRPGDHLISTVPGQASLRVESNSRSIGDVLATPDAAPQALGIGVIPAAPTNVLTPEQAAERDARVASATQQRSMGKRP